ncbi:MAG: cadmium-translocating P-type ATPase [Deltaproteobacteria bacterium]|nr:cadmium-translocating P-type ATPase [Deltaproteobacteria bacterium]
MEAQSKPAELIIEGMHCSGCASGIENHLRRIGVNGALVDYPSSSAQFIPDSDFSRSRVAAEIEKLGYKVRIGPPDVIKQSSKLAPIEKKFLFALIPTIPLLLHMVLPWPLLHNQWFQLALALPVYVLGALHFGSSAFKSLKSGIPNMDVLIFIGATAAFAYSLAGTLLSLGPDYLFYETSASIITAVLLGNVLEKRSIRKTTSAIEDLSRMQSGSVRVIREDSGRETVVDIPIEKLRVGELVLANTGDKVGADGIIESGDGTFDESMLTGESSPVFKKAGEQVVGGTILISGTMRYRTSAVGENTVLSGIIKLVKETQRNKPEIQRLGDRVSAVFVPIVLLIAFITFTVSYLFAGIIFSQAMLNSVAVLVIACPCAMGLATPTAVMVGIGRAVREGILIRGGDTIEKLATIKSVIFDKTGTITTGRFSLESISTFGITKSEAESLIASIERNSSHPIAESLLRELKGVPLLELQKVTEERGVGMNAVDMQGRRYQLGSRRVLHDPADDTGASLYLTLEGKPVAAVNIADELKPNAAKIIESLKSMGLEAVLLSGDRAAKCEQIAASVGISEVYAEKLPHEKLDIIQRIESGGMPAAFVGDGINDAPALARASVGVSLSDATQVAIQSAQVVLLNGNLEHLVSAIRISRRTLTTVKQNLFWAFFYNVLAIPVAALGYLNPMIAAFAMAFSDVIVIGNSLRLRNQRTGG